MIKERVEDGIVIITLSHGATNSITLDTLRQMDAIVKKVNEDDALKGIVLTGDGRFFSSGFHLPDFIGFQSHEEAVAWFEEEEELLTNFFTCEKPVVSAINGHCAAAGLIWSFAADYRLVKNHPKIRMGMSEIKIGLPLSIAQYHVVRFGLNDDRTYRNVMFFGEMVGVEKALEIGMVDEIVEEDQLVERAKQIVTSWIDTPNRPFLVMKKMMRQDTADSIRSRLASEPWRAGFDIFTKPEVRGTLEFVQSMMDGKN
ncbi:enoyl-CoA hydratase/isomerase family protein [Desulfoluna butyratoxydans]|uniref:Crotonase superfamily n=1 Tax=Desulfoluna butyratoxydans TaxID=231438 RepID=A0A4U8YT05_9BACT|nr:enoyl-CoA hydratase/isomerase family protein [Desulfoluna butyratoxydans]VFQ44982.1 crotonase superfamily [Desulfoluna butyratoxydans]